MDSVSIPQQAGSNARLAPTEKARLLQRLVDELIPGAEGWPSASEAGVHGIVALRLFADGTTGMFDTIAERVDWPSGALDSDDRETRIAAVRAFEAADPDLFEKIYAAVTLAYYETPFVVEAIAVTGRPYSIRPHVSGYPMAPFDYARDTPMHGRGHYLKTDDVVPVDTSALDLDTKKTVRWGIER
ncbi:hypothetical protein ACLE20_02065 [Rhizobium sp. YIM 134829]|uniref:hypothetical protein n=1 Tax=Rhizobium sp. YIM 134829 TaxID=3390453 RepID=UPI0039785CDF